VLRKVWVVGRPAENVLTAGWFMERIFFGTGPLIDGKQAVTFVPLGPSAGQWQDLNGDHVAYGPVEHIEYSSTLGEQIFYQRGARA